MTGPWTFDEARSIAAQQAQAQKQAEDFTKQAWRQSGEKERAYRVALAQKIITLHQDEGVAWSSTEALAKGDAGVAKLKFEWDVAEGVKEAASQAAWKANQDRKDAHALITWSMRRELAEVMG